MRNYLLLLPVVILSGCVRVPDLTLGSDCENATPSDLIEIAKTVLEPIRYSTVAEFLIAPEPTG